MSEVSTLSPSDAPEMFTVARHSPGNKGELQYRPVARTSLLLDQLVWGDKARWRRVENVLLHYVVVLFFYYVVLRAFGDIRVALSSAMIFALHPLAVEPVNSLMARDGTLAALFMLFSLIALMRARQGRLLWVLVAICAFALSILSLESSMLLCLFIVCMFFLSRGDSFRIRASALTVFLLIAAAYFYLRVFLHGADTAYEFMRPAFWDADLYGVTIASMYKYMSMLVYPFSLNVGYELSPVDVSSFEWIMAISSLAVLLTAALLPWTPGALRASSIWIIVFSLPFLNSIPYASMHLSDRYVYLALPGICLLMGWCISSLLVRQRYFATLLLAGLLVVMTMETYRQNIVWTDDFTLWGNAVERSPSSSYANYNMGRIHEEIDARAKAITYYDAAIHLDPANYASHFGLGNIYRRTQRYSLAINHYSMALLRTPENKWINLYVGDVHVDMEQWDSAVYAYSRYLEGHPRDPTAHHKTAVALQGKGDYTGAMVHYTEALSSWPGYAKAHFDFSQLLLKINDRENARHELKLALLIKPEYSEARMHLNKLEGNVPSH